MKKMLTIILAIALFWMPTFAASVLDDPEWAQLFIEDVTWRMEAAEKNAKAEIAKINDMATLEKMAKDDRDPLMQRHAIDKLNEMKNSSVITNEVEQASPETPPAQPERPASNKPLLWVLVIVLLAIIGGVAAWRRGRKNDGRGIRVFEF